MISSIKNSSRIAQDLIHNTIALKMCNRFSTLKLEHVCLQRIAEIRLFATYNFVIMLFSKNDFSYPSSDEIVCLQPSADVFNIEIGGCSDVLLISES